MFLEIENILQESITFTDALTEQTQKAEEEAQTAARSVGYPCTEEGTEKHQGVTTGFSNVFSCLILNMARKINLAIIFRIPSF
jgi:hypothetical protein